MKSIDEEVFKKNIANKIKEFRKISQEALAEKAELSEDTISKIEREMSIINTLTLVKLCNSLKVTPNDILGDFLEISPKDGELFEKIATLSEDEKEFLVYIINYIKKK